MEKPYLNVTELSIILGQGRRYADRVMRHLREVAKENNYYIPDSGRDILIPTHLVKKELKLKEITFRQQKSATNTETIDRTNK